MKFNEKLIKLRKETGLSQEELGEKIGVTRQTISKWELGETTPEMNKLLEIANVFEINIDELTNEKDVRKNTVDTSNGNKKRNIIIVIIIILIVLLGFGVLAGARIVSLVGTTFSNIINTNVKIQEEAKEKYKEFEKSGSKVENVLKSSQEKYDKEKIESEKRKFNLDFELGVGTKSNTVVQSLINKVVTSNQKNERKTTIKYNDKIISDVNEMRKIKRDFDDTSDKFEVYLEYDNEGFVNQVVIEKI